MLWHQLSWISVLLNIKGPLIYLKYTVFMERELTVLSYILSVVIWNEKKLNNTNICLVWFTVIKHNESYSIGTDNLLPQDLIFCFRDIKQDITLKRNSWMWMNILQIFPQKPQLCDKPVGFINLACIYNCLTTILSPRTNTSVSNL